MTSSASPPSPPLGRFALQIACRAMDAILDRIVHNAYRLELEGASMRKTIAKMDDEIPQT
jgi:hypothetical protein